MKELQKDTRLVDLMELNVVVLKADVWVAMLVLTAVALTGS